MVQPGPPRSRRTTRRRDPVRRPAPAASRTTCSTVKRASARPHRVRAGSVGHVTTRSTGAGPRPDREGVAGSALDPGGGAGLGHRPCADRTGRGVDVQHQAAPAGEGVAGALPDPGQRPSCALPAHLPVRSRPCRGSAGPGGGLGPSRAAGDRAAVGVAGRSNHGQADRGGCGRPRRRRCLAGLPNGRPCWPRSRSTLCRRRRGIRAPGSVPASPCARWRSTRSTGSSALAAARRGARTCSPH